MIHGDLKGVGFLWLESLILPTIPAQANVLVDETGRALLTDFGLLTIISDPTNLLSSSSYTQGGTARWMSPERIAPQKFGCKDGRPTKPSDCYALGMVVYETISGNVPFHKCSDIAVFMKVVEGERPPRGPRFRKSLWGKSLWGVLELCWTAQPNDRPSIEDVLWHLELASNLPELPFPAVDEAMDGGGDDRDQTAGSSDTLNRANDTTTTEWSAATSPSDYLTDRSPSPVSTTPGPSVIEANNDADANSLGRDTMHMNIQYVRFIIIWRPVY